MNTELTLPDYFDPVVESIVHAHLVAWDTCHKIYLAMDEEQAEWFRDHYSPAIVEGTAEEMLSAVAKWWDDSCFLRFVSAVATSHDDTKDVVTSVIPQFADEGENEDEDEEDGW